MKNTFGNNITVTIFGESHGPAIGAVIDGMPPGIKIDSGFIKKQLDKGKDFYSTCREWPGSNYKRRLWRLFLRNTDLPSDSKSEPAL